MMWQHHSHMHDCRQQGIEEHDAALLASFILTINQRRSKNMADMGRLDELTVARSCSYADLGRDRIAEGAGKGAGLPMVQKQPHPPPSYAMLHLRAALTEGS